MKKDIITTHRIIIGDSRNMVDVKDENVQLIITSPPYWQLKDYGHKEQIGFDDSYENYINNLNIVWLECYRVLSPGCRLCINIGDQFARSVYYGRYKIIPIRTEIIKFCETIGFDYMGAIIWQKVTTTHTTGGATIMGSYPFPRNGILKLDYEFIMLFKKLGKPPAPDKDYKKLSKLSMEEWNEYFAGHWYFNGEKQSGHLAMFPEELPKRLIKMYSFVGDTILDPFLGSGTTSLAALNLKRNSIGYEINEEFIPIIKKKLKINENELFLGYDQIDIIKQKKRKTNFDKELKALPYIFVDSKKIDKKIDPRKLAFGSKISGKEKKFDSAIKVKRIISVNKIELENRLTLRLLGVVPILSMKEKAMEYLSDTILSKKVNIKFDVDKYDEHDNLLGYVYLTNKTFVNAKLIKNGLAKPSKDNAYKYKNRFQQYYQQYINSNNDDD